jgi:hypothetical protein
LSELLWIVEGAPKEEKKQWEISEPGEKFWRKTGDEMHVNMYYRPEMIC